MIVEKGLGSLPKLDDGGPAFVIVDLRIGEPGVVIDGGVHKAVTDPETLLRFVSWPIIAAMNTPSSSRSDLAELLDIDVD